MEWFLGLLFKVASVFVCLVPRRYRRSWPIRADADLRVPAIASGVLEILIGAPGTALYVAVGLNAAKSGLGLAGLVLNPMLLFPFMLVEGIVRMLAAVGSAEILPTLPLQIVAWIHAARDGRAEDRERGELVVDVVEREDGVAYNLCIRSCRAKPHWNNYMTIRFEGDFYQMVREESGAGERKFVYLLRKNPPWRPVVVVYEYRPEDVLYPEVPPRRWKPGARAPAVLTIATPRRR